MPDLNYCIQTSDSIPESFSLKTLETLLDQECDLHTMSLIVLGRDPMRQMNQLYNGGEISTDILTFTEEEGSGDMFICPKNIALYASIHGVPFEVRYWHLIVHGLTHLKNLDHQELDEAHIFSQDEKNRWDRLGLLIPHLKLWSWDLNYIYHYKGA